MIECVHIPYIYSLFHTNTHTQSYTHKLFVNKQKMKQKGFLETAKAATCKYPANILKGETHFNGL